MKKIEQLPCLFQAEIPSEEFSQSPHISLCFENHLICSRSSQIDVISILCFQRITECLRLEGISEGYWVQSGPPRASFSKTMSFDMVLNVSEDGGFTTSLSSLCQCLVTLTVKEHFLMFRRNLLFQFVPIASILVTGHY